MNFESDQRLVIPPPAGRLIESLRDTGYTFTTAVADIVDNSVSAEADTISVKLSIERGSRPVLWIADDGQGMNDDELIKAMTYGSPKRPSQKSLGKFGMGLKTASTSFCRKLTVISRSNGQLHLYQWDLDVIIVEGVWRLIRPDSDDYSEAIQFLADVTKNGNGTIVVWENIDRLVSANSAGVLKNQIKNLVKDLNRHLSGIFFNFLTPGGDYPNIKISINDEIVEPWDPFCRWMNEGKEIRVHTHPNKPFVHDIDGEAKGTFFVTVYILPNKNSVNKIEEEKMRFGLDNQGFYIFREGRMIYSGGWPNRLFTKEPHLNLLRVELSFDHKLDDVFQVDIKKARINFPETLQGELKKILAPARYEANRIYRSGSSHSSKAGGLGTLKLHDKSSNSISKHLDEITSGSEVGVVDNIKEEAEITNKFGKSKVRLVVDENSSMVVEIKPSLEDAVLWRPGLIEGNRHAVFLNESHEFYKKFYLSNLDNPALIMAMDSLLWSLAEAELCVTTSTVKRNLEELRISVSRSLRILSEEMPELKEFDNI